MNRQAGQKRATGPAVFRSSHGPGSRAAAVALSVCMVFTAMPTAAFAVEAGEKTGLCQHHLVHTGQCGYQEAKPGHPCEHEHGLECYTDELICGYIEDKDAKASDSNGQHRHTQDCYAFNCPHERGEHMVNNGEAGGEGGHGAACGYIEAAEGAPCGYVCTQCAAPDMVLTAFEVLDQAVQYQSVPAGTRLADLTLPEKLDASGYKASDTETGSKAVAVKGIGWEPDSLWDEEAQQGSYIFTPVLPEGYTLADGAKLPEIYVRVGERVMLTSTNGYDDGDIAVINAMISNNGLVAEPNKPAEWQEYVIWNNENPKRITNLSFHGKNLTGRLNVSGLDSLTTLNCSNNHLSALDGLDSLTSLTALDCSVNELSETLDVGSLTKLINLNCADNLLSALEGLNNLTGLTKLACSGNELSALEGLDSLENLTLLECFDNQLSGTLDVGSLTKLISLNCVDNELSALEGLDRLTKLTSLDCSNNQLPGTLDVSNLTKLTSLTCSNNQLSGTLDVGSLTNLTSLTCSNNQLSGTLDVGSLTKLTSLDCSNNQLSGTLDVGSLTNLTSLICSNNQLSGTLDVGSLTNLNELYCSQNPFAGLKLPGGKQLTVNSAEGGTVTLYDYIHNTKSVSLLAAADSGYVFKEWTADGTELTSPTTAVVAFELDGQITITPKFETEQAAAEAREVKLAKKAIESYTYTLAQTDAGDDAALKAALAQRINTRNNGITSITVTASDIVVSFFRTATAGTVDDPDGEDGAFTFTVNLRKGMTSAVTESISGAITAAPYVDPTPIPTADVGNKRIYANGAPLLLIEGTGGEHYTVVYVDRDGSGTVTRGDTIFDPDGGGSMNGSGEGNDLSSWSVYGGSNGTAITEEPKLTMTGGRIESLFGGGYSRNSQTGSASVTVSGAAWVNHIYGGGYEYGNRVNGDTKVTVSGGTVEGSVYGGGKGCRVTGNASVTISGSTVGWSVYGGDYLPSGSVGGSAVIITDSTVSRGIYMDGVSTDSASVTVGGRTKIGNGLDLGVRIKEENGTTGINSFSIGPDLTGEDGGISLVLPDGYEASHNPVIATNAVEADLAKIKLVGAGAANLAAYFEDGAIKVKKLPPHVHCVCGGNATAGGHTHDAGVTWIPWESGATLPDAAGSYYLTRDVVLDKKWTAPTGTVNLCLNGKNVKNGKELDEMEGGLSNAYVTIPGNAAFAVCDCNSGEGITFTLDTSNENASFFEGLAESSFTLYSGNIQLTKKGTGTGYGVENMGGTFDIYDGSVTAEAYAGMLYGMWAYAGTTTLWGGSFRVRVMNEGARAYNQTVQKNATLRLSGQPALTAVNAFNNDDAAIIYTYSGSLYAHAGNIPYRGAGLPIWVSLSDYRKGFVIREVDDSNKDKFTLANAPTGFALAEAAEGDKTHLALAGPYRVAFNSNGGQGTMADQSFAGYTDPQPLTGNIFTKEGCRFTGWNTKADGSGEAYADKEVVSKLAILRVVTLYAQWESWFKSADATLASLAYKVGDDGRETAVPSFTPGTDTYNVVLPYDTSATASITLSGVVSHSNANITENNGVTLAGGSGGATLTVTAEDGTTAKTYRVNFTTAANPPGDAKQITAFAIENQVGHTVIDQNRRTITVTMPGGADVTGLAPVIAVSEKATVSPQSGVAQNFTAPVVYTVTAENGTAQTYTVVVMSAAPAPSYGISLSQSGTYTFAAATAGYGEQAAHSITVNNSGSQPTGVLTAGLSGSDAGSFTLSGANMDSIAPGGSVAFTVRPNAGLGAGTYTAMVTVSGGNGIFGSFPVSFTVWPQQSGIHTITASAGPGGTIWPGGAITVNQGESKTFTITPDTNYAISQVMVDGADKGALTAWTFEQVTGNHSISATFRYTGGSAGNSSGSDAGSAAETASPTPSITTNTEQTKDRGSVTTITTTSTDSSGKKTIVTTVVRKDGAGNVTGSTSIVTADSITTQSGQENAGITVHPNAAAINSAAEAAGASPQNPLNLTAALPQEAVSREAQKPEVDAVQVNVIVPNSVRDNPAVENLGITVEKETVEAVRQSGKRLEVAVREENGSVKAVWSLDGQEMGDAAGQATDLNLGVHTAPVQSTDPIAAPVKPQVTAEGHENGLVLSLTADGTLLSPAKLTVPATNQTGITAGAWVAVYRFDPNTGALAPAPGGIYSVDTNGNVTIDIPAGTRGGAKETYVLLPIEAETQPETQPVTQPETQPATQPVTQPETQPATQPAADAAGGAAHTVRAGDTLNRISRQYGCRVEDLLALNPGVDIYNLQIGSDLRVR